MQLVLILITIPVIICFWRRQLCRCQRKTPRWSSRSAAPALGRGAPGVGHGFAVREAFANVFAADASMAVRGAIRFVLGAGAISRTPRLLKRAAFGRPFLFGGLKTKARQGSLPGSRYRLRCRKDAMLREGQNYGFPPTLRGVNAAPRRKFRSRRKFNG